MYCFCQVLFSVDQKRSLNIQQYFLTLNFFAMHSGTFPGRGGFPLAPLKLLSSAVRSSLACLSSLISICSSWHWMHPDTLFFLGDSGFVNPALGRFIPTVALILEFADTFNRFAASLTSKSAVMSPLSS